MKFSVAAVLAAATAVSAGYAGSNVTYVTEVVQEYTTYCPEPTTLTHGDKTYTITEATTLTITDCPCTITKPVITSSVVECHDCPEPTDAPHVPETPVEPPHVPEGPKNGTTLVPQPSEPAPPAGEEPSEVPTAGAGKVALSGLAGVVGIAAFML